MRLNMQVVSAGAVTSVGLSIGATTAAIRAGLDNFSDTNFISNSYPIIGARITGLNKKDLNGMMIGGTEEQATWASYAIEECIASAKPIQFDRVLVLVISPDSRVPDLINREKMSHYIYSATRHYCDLDDDRLTLLSLDEGTAGCGAALMRAQEWFVEHPRGSVLIVGADSWLNVPRIRYGLSHERILTEEKAEGFIPSEGAAAILLQVPRKEDSERRRLVIKSVGHSKEAASLYTEKPCFGFGMAEATKTALSDAGVEIHNIHLRLSNVTGEEYFFDEAALAWMRLLRQPMSPDYDWQQPATKIGNMGVAFCVLLIAYTHQLVLSNRYPGSNTLIQLSSEDVSRTVLLLSKH